jgi:hypothetical protein
LFETAKEVFMALPTLHPDGGWTTKLPIIFMAVAAAADHFHGAQTSFMTDPSVPVRIGPPARILEGRVARDDAKDLDVLVNNLSMLPDIENMDKVDPETVAFAKGVREKQKALLLDATKSSAEKNEEVLKAGLDTLINFLKSTGISGQDNIDSVVQSYIRHGSAYTSNLLRVMGVDPRFRPEILKQLGVKLDGAKRHGARERIEVPEESLAVTTEDSEEWDSGLTNPLGGFHSYSQEHNGYFSQAADALGHISYDDPKLMTVTDREEKITMAKNVAMSAVEYKLNYLRETNDAVAARVNYEHKRALKDPRGLIRAGPMIQSAIGREDTVFVANTYNPRLNDQGYRQFYGKM